MEAQCTEDGLRPRFAWFRVIRVLYKTRPQQQPRQEVTMAKLTDKERQERKHAREAVKNWRRELCVQLANDAVKANAEAEPDRQGEYLSPTFLRLIRDFIK